jgi:hypothetical protein
LLYFGRKKRKKTRKNDVFSKKREKSGKTGRQGFETGTCLRFVAELCFEISGCAILCMTANPAGLTGGLVKGVSFR